MDGTPVIIRPEPAELPAHAAELAALLHACVHAGASVGYVLPFTVEDAAAFWTGTVQPAVREGRRVLLVAREADRIVGTVQLDIDTPPNQPHRAIVLKLLVHPEARRRGVARSLMAAVEEQARRHRRTLLTLDTRTGDAAEPLYTALGYATAGTIPGYCLDPITGALDSTTVMHKAL